ncbi:MAG: NAD-dependent epimerase/dehydratase family protein [Ilumatobacter sp.]|uniref:NAD-dependent epimerase/dehydratase family protein n=1 Tax=Ilumatobacter sp. TaxID=1967498 RepID=UPI003919F374
MNVVVIGGAGFIGSHLVDRLLAEGHVVDVIDTLSPGSLANLADARATRGPLKIHHLDASSSEADSLFGMRRPEVVYHLALFDRHDRSAQAQAQAFSSALATLESARRHGVSKVVAGVPASSLYGQPAASALPMKESELVPRGVRGVAARAVVDLLTTYRERHAIEFTALAFSSVYGPRQAPSGGVVAALHEALLTDTAPTLDGDGRQTRDFVYIDDVVDALVRAGDRGSGLVINVGTGVQTTIRDLWTALRGGAGLDPISGPPRIDDLPRFAVSPVRARIHLGWSPWTDVSTGLRRVLAPD